MKKFLQKVCRRKSPGKSAFESLEVDITEAQLDLLEVIGKEVELLYPRNRLVPCQGCRSGSWYEGQYPGE